MNDLRYFPESYCGCFRPPFNCLAAFHRSNLTTFAVFCLMYFMKFLRSPDEKAKPKDAVTSRHSGKQLQGRSRDSQEAGTSGPQPRRSARNRKPDELKEKPDELKGKPAEPEGRRWPSTRNRKPDVLEGKPDELKGKPDELKGKPAELEGRGRPSTRNRKPGELDGKPDEQEVPEGKLAEPEGSPEAPEVPEVPDSPENEFKRCKRAELKVASVKARQRMPRQTTVSELTRFNLPTLPSSEQMQSFYENSREFFKTTYPFRVPGSLKDDSLMAASVTPKEEDLEECTHPLVVLQRESDGAEAELLVEDHSSYVVASRVIHMREDREKIPFCYFGEPGGDLPDRFYVKVAEDKEPCLHRTHFKPSYKHLPRVRVYESVLEVIFKFLEKLQANPGQRSTKDFELLLDTLFVIIAEGRRFYFIGHWIIIKIVIAMCDESAIPDWFPDVIQDWSDLCKCIFELYLALLEESLRTGQPDDLMQEIARLSMDKAIALWEKRQSKVDPNNFRFYEEKVPLHPWLADLCYSSMMKRYGIRF